MQRSYAQTSYLPNQAKYNRKKIVQQTKQKPTLSKSMNQKHCVCCMQKRIENKTDVFNSGKPIKRRFLQVNMDFSKQGGNGMRDHKVGLPFPINNAKLYFISTTTTSTS